MIRTSIVCQVKTVRFLCLRPTYCCRRQWFCPVRPCVLASVRLCVRLCVMKHCQHDILHSIWHIFIKLTSTMLYGTEMNASQFGVKRSKVKVTVEVCWKQHLLTRCLEKYQSDFHQTYMSDVLWDRDEYFKFWDQKVIDQGHGRITCAGTITVQSEAYVWCRVRLSVWINQ